MLHAVGDVDDDNDDGDGGGGCAADDSVILSVSFILFVFETCVKGGKLILFLECFWFFLLFSLLG